MLKQLDWKEQHRKQQDEAKEKREKEIEEEKLRKADRDLELHLWNQRNLELEKSARIAGAKRVSVQAISFSSIFDETTGRDLLLDLSGVQNIEVFGLDMVRNIVKFLWKFYRRQITKWIFIPFALYFVLFLLYATWINKEKDDEDERWGDWYYANFIFCIAILILVVWNGFFELRLIAYYGWDYFTTLWNILDVLSICTNLFVIIADLSDMRAKTRIPFLSIAVLLMWMKLYYFGRMFMSTAWMVRMIVEVTWGMGYFLIIFTIAVLAFANSFMLIARNTSPIFTDTGVGNAFLYSYRTGIGDFNTDGFDFRDEVLTY